MVINMKKRILSIDGGGIKGIFAAQFLAKIEEEYGIKICDYFDIIAGTSTGAIVAAALAIGMPAKDIVSLYDECGEKIFKGYSVNIKNKFIKKCLIPVSQLNGTVKVVFHRKYNSKDLKECLEKQFGERKIGESRTRLLIPAVNLDTGGVEVFKTAHDKEFMTDYKARIVDVLMATTAAPTYFSAYDFKGRGRFIDGGLGANNPSNIAVIEAMARCEWEKEDLFVLSIGYSNSKEHISRDIELNGVHAKDIISTFMNAESQYSDNISKFLLEPERFMRIIPAGAQISFAMDDASENARTTWKNIANRTYAINMTKIKKIFFDVGKKDDFIPEYRV